MPAPGYAAIEYAETYGMRLAKHADPTEDAREGLTPDEAREVASEDPSLIYMTLTGDDEIDATDFPPRAYPGTQAYVVGRHRGLASLGHVVDGCLYKPDAVPTSRGVCRCGRRGVWISGAGEYLCAAHQDDY